MSETYMVVSVKDLEVLLKKARAAAETRHAKGSVEYRRHCVVIALDPREDANGNTQIQIPVGYTHGDRQF